MIRIIVAKKPTMHHMNTINTADLAALGISREAMPAYIILKCAYPLRANNVNRCSIKLLCSPMLAKAPERAVLAFLHLSEASHAMGTDLTGFLGNLANHPAIRANQDATEIICEILGPITGRQLIDSNDDLCRFQMQQIFA